MKTWKTDIYKCDTIKEWVEADGIYAAVDRGVEPAATVASRLSMANLVAAHSEATIALCGPIPDDLRERWLTALDAVCNEIGARFERLGAKDG
jgi:hypothetical protein